MPASDTRVLTAHVPSQLAKKVDDIAERLDRSRAWIVKQALERRRLTIQALADVDAGRTVDESEVEAWAQSLSTANR